MNYIKTNVLQINPDEAQRLDAMKDNERTAYVDQLFRILDIDDTNVRQTTRSPLAETRRKQRWWLRYSSILWLAYTCTENVRFNWVSIDSCADCTTFTDFTLTSRGGLRNIPPRTSFHHKPNSMWFALTCCRQDWWWMCVIWYVHRVHRVREYCNTAGCSRLVVIYIWVRAHCRPMPAEQQSV